MFEAPVQRLIDELARLPGVGQKSAQRLAFHLLHIEQTDAVRLAEAIVAMRDEFQQMGLNFVIHVDGAWGGYFKSMLCADERGLLGDPADIIDRYPLLTLSEHFRRHFAALNRVDSITLDPHKSGFIPYPAGGLCYRNRDMRNLIAYAAPVVTHGDIDKSVGSFGIEGSKPGAA